MKGKTIKELELGQKGSFQKTITEADVTLFAGVTGDLNPVHINQIVAEQSIFKTRVVHGMLTASLISAALGTSLPGEGAIYLGQTLKFLHPVYIGDTILAEVEVAEIKLEKNIVKMTSICTNQDGKVVISGESTLMPVKE